MNEYNLSHREFGDQRIIRVRDVMMDAYVMVEGVMTVADAIVIAKQRQVKALNLPNAVNEVLYLLRRRDSVLPKRYEKLLDGFHAQRLQEKTPLVPSS